MINICNFIQQQLWADDFQIPPHRQAVTVIGNLIATPKNILTIFLLAAYVTVCGQTKTIPNKIDSLKTDKDAFTFVRQHFQKYDGKESFDYYRNETRQIADSLKVRNWVKADIDNN